MRSFMTHVDIKNDRDKYLSKILESDAQYKLVIAGPGTGKSYTFKRLLEVKQGKRLAVTFINKLAKDMEKNLSGLAEVRTFHSLCRKLLHELLPEGIDNLFIFFPKLNQIITEDAKLLCPNIIIQGDTIQNAFQKFDVTNEAIAFFMERANFYNAVGFDDSVYRVILAFEKNNSKIPQFTQIVVDEFQDFNALEVISSIIWL